MWKWVFLVLTLGFWALTWPQILPPEADLPPCHMMVPIAICGIITFFGFRQDRINREAKARKAAVAPPTIVREDDELNQQRDE